MVATGVAGGGIIITSSTQGQHGTLFGASYSASKWGLIGPMKSAALELGRHGITVNAVIPALIDTSLTRARGPLRPGGQRGREAAQREPPSPRHDHDLVGVTDRAIVTVTPRSVRKT
jgi:NAD(P)-dependent dehydrogenase (short-subunit alcohol dehydrogenase family)